ncbi:MAG TPA: hypothetical protein VM261_11525 [Kofleriaceae bacterium]|nr:hypothetical protein [Kofleriaceae bacterium]
MSAGCPALLVKGNLKVNGGVQVQVHVNVNGGVKVKVKVEVESRR